MGRNIKMKVSFTLSAKKLLSELKEVHGDDLLFHQSGGCCDGSAPMCYPVKEYTVGNSDVKLGEVDGTPFYINEDQYEISNVDITYVGQLPKLNPYIPQIRKNLSEDLEIGIDCVSCKATTTDFLGFEGSKEGVSCHAVALIKK